MYTADFHVLRHRHFVTRPNRNPSPYPHPNPNPSFGQWILAFKNPPYQVYFICILCIVLAISRSSPHIIETHFLHSLLQSITIAKLSFVVCVTPYLARMTIHLLSKLFNRMKISIISTARIIIKLINMNKAYNITK